MAGGPARAALFLPQACEVYSQRPFQGREYPASGFPPCTPKLFDAVPSCW
jgi:hypothetical protein